MSLTAALASATSSLRAIQVQMAVASANISNADTEGYTKKTAEQTSTTTTGVGTGVTITGITSSVSVYLVRSIVEATSENGEASVTSDFLSKLADLMGTLSSDSDTSGDTLATALSELESALDELATTPESETLLSQVVETLEQITGDLQDLSDSVQDLRAEADGEIASTVTEVNDALTTIDKLNDTIVRAKAMGESTADLEDQRTTALLTVASALDVSYYTDSTGRMTVYTKSGQALVNSSAHLLSYEAAGSVNASTVFSGITVNGTDITDDIGSGELAALVELRDVTLPEVQAELDTLATTLADSVNTAANAGTAVPPPSTLTATLVSSASDSFSGTGTLRVAVTDSDGVAVTVADLDLSSYSTVGDLASALDAISGVAASLDANGNLVVSAETSGNGIAFADVSSSVGSSGFSDYFGFNDILVGDGAASLAVRASLSEDSTLFPVGALDDSTTTPAAGDTVVSTAAGAQASALADALREASFAASGGLSAQDGSFADYAAAIVSDVAVRTNSAESAASGAETALSTLTDTFSSNYGVNVDEETARIATLENAYAASAQVLSAVNEMFDALLDAVG